VYPSLSFEIENPQPLHYKRTIRIFNLEQSPGLAKELV
jgi:hypothetical protein